MTNEVVRLNSIRTAKKVAESNAERVANLIASLDTCGQACFELAAMVSSDGKFARVALDYLEAEARYGATMATLPHDLQTR
jgi:hypothetical protein